MNRKVIIEVNSLQFHQVGIEIEIERHEKVKRRVEKRYNLNETRQWKKKIEKKKMPTKRAYA